MGEPRCPKCGGYLYQGWHTLCPGKSIGEVADEAICIMTGALRRELAEAAPFMAALKTRHNGYDPAAAAMFPDGPPATPEIALDELLAEERAVVESELTVVKGQLSEALGGEGALTPAARAAAAQAARRRDSIMFKEPGHD